MDEKPWNESTRHTLYKGFSYTVCVCSFKGKSQRKCPKYLEKREKDRYRIFSFGKKKQERLCDYFDGNNCGLSIISEWEQVKKAALEDCPLMIHDIRTELGQKKLSERFKRA